MTDLAIIIAGFSIVAAVFWCGKILLRTNRCWFWKYAGLIVAAIVSALISRTFVGSVLLLPLGVFALAQIPLLTFSPPDDGRGPTEPKEEMVARLLFGGRYRGPFLLLVASSLFGGLYFALEGDGLLAPEWFELIGILPLIASFMLLVKAASKVGKWWGIGLNPITFFGVLPVFAVRYPEQSRQSLVRFLFWFAVTFALSFGDAAVRGGDPLTPIGLALATVGGSALLGAMTWLVVIGVQYARALWISSKRPDNREAVRLPGGWNAAKAPVLLAAAGGLVWLGGVLAYGDLVHDRHRMSRNRSRSDLLFGCGWSRQIDELLVAKDAPLETSNEALRQELLAKRLATFRFAPDESSAAAKPGSSSHDPAIAVACAKASVLVYAPANTIRETARRWGYPDERIKVIGFGSAQPGPTADPQKPGRDQALILADDRNVLVAFRGTDQFSDWWTNLEFLPTDWLKPEWRHEGFEGALNRIWPELVASLNQVRHTNQPVWLTGHSLGGSLAVLASMRLSDDLKVGIRGLYTFGQPRIANDAFASRLGQRVGAYYRFVFHRDIVPTLGTPGSIHAGELRYIDSLGIVRPNDHWTVMLRDEICTRCGSIAAHGKWHYLTMLELQEGISEKTDRR